MKTKTKKIIIPKTVIQQIQTDIDNHSVKIYNFNDLPSVFVGRNLIHPEIVSKSTEFYAACSGSTVENRAYMFIAAARLDHQGSNLVTDIDPIVMVAQLDDGQPYPSGAVNFHGSFSGRTEPLNPIGSSIRIEDLRNNITSETIPFEKAPPRLIEAMHYVADRYKKVFD